MNEETLSSTSGDASVPVPTLGERVSHIFGVHSWHPVGGASSARVQCSGCRQVRHAGGRPAFDDDLEALLRSDEQVLEEEPVATPRFGSDDDTFPYRDAPSTPSPRRDTGEQSAGASAWKWIMGLQWWVKIWLLFILLQLVGFIISLFT